MHESDRASERERERERETKSALRPETEKEREKERKYSNDVGQGLDGLWRKFIAAVHHWCYIRKKTNRFSDKAVFACQRPSDSSIGFPFGGGEVALSSSYDINIHAHMKLF